jgi:hypothetical protein
VGSVLVVPVRKIHRRCCHRAPSFAC